MRAFEKRKPNSTDSSSFFGPKIQKKLKTGTVGDKYEVEADHVADKVVNNNSSVGGLLQSKEEVQQKPISETITSVQAKDIKEEEPVQKKSDKKEEEKPVQKKSEKKEEEPIQKKEEEKEPIQKKEKEEEKPVQKKDEKEESIQAKCDDCEKEVQKKDKKEEEKPVQKKEQAFESETQDNELEGKLNNSKGGGEGLGKKTKKEMESGFGADFSNVKIHTDTNAIQMSQELGAQAFTNGSDVYFNKGKYNPESKEGKHLLAHELTHTIQQTGAAKKTGTVQKSSIQNGGSEDLEAPEFQHEYKLEQAHDNLDHLTIGSKGEPVRKVQEGLMDLGYQLPKFGADSDFGNETKQAVLEFQSDNKLTYDGVVGVQTMGRLDDIKAGNLRGNPCGEGTALPQLGRTFNIDDQKTLDGTFCSKGDFSITATAKWAGPHPNNEKHYHIVIHPENGKVNSPTRRFDVNGKPENQPFKVTTKDDRLFFKVTVMVINNSKKNPKLSGTISIF